MKEKGVYYALGAGLTWGLTLGIFARTMKGMGFSAMQIAAVRTTFSAIAFILLALFKDRRAFRIKLKDGWIFLCSGFVSVTLFCWFYFTAVANCSLAIAGTLQYTAPVWVVIFSALVFKERITKVKVAVMCIAICGCVLVSGIIGSVGNVSLIGIISGILSGTTFGLYTIFTRFAIPKYSIMTINIYTFMVASISSLLLAGPARTVTAVLDPAKLPTAIIGGIMCAAVPYYLYSKALQTIDNAKASILTTVEPVIAAMVSVFYYHEEISLAAFIGILLILVAVMLLAVPRKSKPQAPLQCILAEEHTNTTQF